MVDFLKLPGGVTIGSDGIKTAPNSVGEAIKDKATGTQSSYTVKIGEPSPLAASLEKYMKDNDLKVKESGSIDLAEAKALEKSFKGFKPLKGEVQFEGASITLSANALKMLGIDAPKAAEAAQAPQAAPATPSAPASADAGKSAADAVGAAGTAIKEGAMSFLEKAKAAGRELTKCTTESHAEYNTAPCVKQREDNASRGRN